MSAPCNATSYSNSACCIQKVYSEKKYVQRALLFELGIERLPIYFITTKDKILHQTTERKKKNMRHSFLAVQKKYDEKDKTSQHCSNKIIARLLDCLAPNSNCWEFQQPLQM